MPAIETPPATPDHQLDPPQLEDIRGMRFRLHQKLQAFLKAPCAATADELLEQITSAVLDKRIAYPNASSIRINTGSIAQITKITGELIGRMDDILEFQECSKLSAPACRQAGNLCNLSV